MKMRDEEKRLELWMKNTTRIKPVRIKPVRFLPVLALLVIMVMAGVLSACGTEGGADPAEGGADLAAEGGADPAAEGGADPAAEGPDLQVYDNGYGTVFVTGRRIEHPADTSTSIVVDWSNEPQAKAGEDLDLIEENGLVYEKSLYTDGKYEGKELDLHMNLKVPAAAARSTGQQSAQAAEGGSAAAQLAPVVILVPGGGFISCRIDGKYEEVQRYLVQAGYAVAIMEYHIIGQGRYMDAADDVQAAIDWVLDHGREHGLDPDRIALMGNSGGGYVAALMACRNSEDIRCVVNFYGLSDLLNNKADYEDAAIEAHHKANSSDSQFVNGVDSGLGLTDAPEEAEKADPANYVDGDEPPFLHLHGDQDLLVSPSQSLHLHEALLAAGDVSTRYVVTGAGHGDQAFRTTAALDTVIAFLDQYCKK